MWVASKECIALSKLCAASLGCYQAITIKLVIGTIIHLPKAFPTVHINQKMLISLDKDRSLSGQN